MSGRWPALHMAGRVTTLGRILKVPFLGVNFLFLPIVYEINFSSSLSLKAFHNLSLKDLFNLSFTVNDLSPDQFHIVSHSCSLLHVFLPDVHTLPPIFPSSTYSKIQASDTAHSIKTPWEIVIKKIRLTLDLPFHPLALRFGTRTATSLNLNFLSYKMRKTYRECKILQRKSQSS